MKTDRSRNRSGVKAPATTGAEPGRVNRLVWDEELGLWAVLDFKHRPLLIFAPGCWDEPLWRGRVQQLTGLANLPPVSEALSLKEALHGSG